MCVICVYVQRPEGMSGHLELELRAALSCAAVVPGTECASSLRIASVLHHWVISPAPISIFFLKKNMTGGVDGQTGRHTNSQTQERTQNCLPSFFSYKARTRERGQVGISWRRRGSKWWLSLRPKVLAHHTFCLVSLYVLSLQSPECAMALAH